MLTAIVVLLSVILFFQILFGLAQSGSMKTNTEAIEKLKQAVENNSVHKMFERGN